VTGSASIALNVSTLLAMTTDNYFTGRTESIKVRVAKTDFGGCGW
jgi:hypothetical protein